MNFGRALQRILQLLERKILGARDLQDRGLAAAAQLAAEGRFTIPIAGTFALEDWREALDLSNNQRARGKLGPVDKPNPDPNGCKDDKGREALKEFIVARCDAP